METPLDVMSDSKNIETLSVSHSIGNCFHLKLFQCFISYVTTSETEIKIF